MVLEKDFFLYSMNIDLKNQFYSQLKACFDIVSINKSANTRLNNVLHKFIFILIGVFMQMERYASILILGYHILLVIGTDHNTPISAQPFLETECQILPSVENFLGFHLDLWSPSPDSMPLPPACQWITLLLFLMVTFCSFFFWNDALLLTDG